MENEHDKMYELKASINLQASALIHVHVSLCQLLLDREAHTSEKNFLLLWKAYESGKNETKRYEVEFFETFNSENEDLKSKTFLKIVKKVFF